MKILSFVRFRVFRRENGLKLLSAHRFVREQELRHGDELRLVAHKDGLAALVGRIHDGLDLLTGRKLYRILNPCDVWR